MPRIMRRMKISLILLACLLTAGNAAIAELSYDQVVVRDVYNGVEVHDINVRTLPHQEVNITIDGVVDEPVWQRVPPFDQMIVTTPDLGKPSDYPTATRFVATEQGLYVSSVMNHDLNA